MFEGQEIRAGVPVYPDVIRYQDTIMDLRIWEGDGWKQESVSWKANCYIHSGLSGYALKITGADATDFLSKTSINNVYKWKIGKMKHLVQLNEDGYIANHTLTTKDGENEYRMMACPPWPLYMSLILKMDVKVEFIPLFIHQISGPKAKEIIEAASGEDISDVKFLEFRLIRLPSIDADFEVARIGMSGTIAYEIRGHMKYSAEAYDIIYQTGKRYDMKRLGWRTYCVNHAEGGFPQGGSSFTYALDEGFLKMLGDKMARPGFSGSYDPADVTKRYRTPYDVDWGWTVKYDHDFIGREALEKIKDNPPRKIVTLEWNQEDVMDVWASMFGLREKEYKIFELPCLEPQMAGGQADIVTKDGKEVGISSFSTYSYYYRSFISHCTIDADLNEGDEVIVHWGEFGGNIKEIRAKVTKYPYSTLKKNQQYYEK